MTGNADTGEMENRGFWLRGEHEPLLVLAGGVVIVASVLTPAVWPVVLTDGAYVAAVILAAAGWGAWPVVWLGLRRRPLGQQFCLATALGLGVLSTVTLALGVGGLLNAVVVWGLLGGGGILGLVRVYLAQAESGRLAGAPAATRPPGKSAVTRLAVRCKRGLAPSQPPLTIPKTAFREVPVPFCNGLLGVGLRSLALLPVCLPLAIALFGATLPPGVLWSSEAQGYDVLEYHLQVPREHFEAGRIQFLPHNVYASFPQQVETLYLLLMYLTNDPLRAAIPAQLLHTSLGVLAVIALVCWSAPGWPRILVALVAGCVPWLAQLGCLAYVELGMLFFAAVAGGLVIDHFRRDTTCDWRSALAAGLCAGLAGGCKYTGVALVSAALGVAWLVTMRGGLRTRLLRFAIFTVGALAAMSPWLIRNAAFTRNPVYPFAYKWFGGAAWSAEQDAQWARGHRLPEDSDSIAGRARIIGDELYGSSMYGPTLWVLAAVGFALRPSRRSWLAAVWFALIVVVWATCTHMPGRFALPLVVPLTLLAGTSVASNRAETSPGWLAKTRRLAVGPLVLVAAAGGLWNGAALADMLRSDGQSWHRLTGLRLAEMVGATETLWRGNPINMAVHHPNAHVWLVGEARAFYVQPQAHYSVAFNRDPWLEFAMTATPEECIGWLRSRNITHVVFSWPEIRRLRRTYGFSPLVTPAWVAKLERAGLRRIEPDEAASRGKGIEVYEVPQE